LGIGGWRWWLQRVVAMCDVAARCAGVRCGSHGARPRHRPQILTANMYRNWDETLTTFRYVADQTGWSWGARELARWSGAVMMWQVMRPQGRLPHCRPVPGAVNVHKLLGSQRKGSSPPIPPQVSAMRSAL
jgi:hypothetical protein